MKTHNELLEIAILAMKENMEKTDLRSSTEKALTDKHNFNDEEAKKYTELAFEWWLDAYYS